MKGFSQRPEGKGAPCKDERTHENPGKNARSEKNLSVVAGGESPAKFGDEWSREAIAYEVAEKQRLPPVVTN